MSTEPLTSDLLAPECDHDWISFEYDPSVGIMFTGSTCAKCGVTIEREPEDFDDNYM